MIRASNELEKKSKNNIHANRLVPQKQIGCECTGTAGACFTYVKPSVYTAAGLRFKDDFTGSPFVKCNVKMSVGHENSLETSWKMS